jgi:hypothetical protein
VADRIDAFPSLEDPLVIPGGTGRLAPAWYRFFVALWKRSARIGECNFYAGATVPDGTLLCNHQAVSRTTYAGLFLVIGTTYGAGDGVTTFNVPNIATVAAPGFWVINF